jgi:membrane associated rhomboid family serine protease
MAQRDTPNSFGIPKPGKAVIGVAAALFAVWLMFAMAINWGDASFDLFLRFCGSQEAIARGEVWRLFTAPFMHYPKGDISHILWAVLGLLFLAPQLEERWGQGRFLRFLFFSSLIAYGFQFGAGLLLPASIRERLVPAYWFGAFPVLEAVSIAWALNFRDQQIRLMFVLPINAKHLIWFVVGINLLHIIAGGQPFEGLLAPFGGMFAGWLLGGGTPSPLRRAYLRWRLAGLDREMERAKRTKGDNKANLSVIQGGRTGPRETSKPRRGTNGSWLN